MRRQRKVRLLKLLATSPKRLKSRLSMAYGLKTRRQTKRHQKKWR